MIKFFKLFIALISLSIIGQLFNTFTITPLRHLKTNLAITRLLLHHLIRPILKPSHQILITIHYITLPIVQFNLWYSMMIFILSFLELYIIFACWKAIMHIVILIRMYLFRRCPRICQTLHISCNSFMRFSLLIRRIIAKDISIVI